MAGRRKTNRVDFNTVARNAAIRTGNNVAEYKKTAAELLRQIEIEIKDGHNVGLGNLGVMYFIWRKPHMGRFGMIRGCYQPTFKYTAKIKKYIKGLEEHDFDYPYVDMYPDGIVTENGILRKRREDAEFFKD